MSDLTGTLYSSNEFTKSNIILTDVIPKENTLREKYKKILKIIKFCIIETTVEPCLFVYMMCVALSSFTVQNMHLEKSCRVNLKFGDDICDRITNRNTTGLEKELDQVQSLVAKVMAWKFPLQTGVPAVLVLFIGAWSDRYKKRKICILVPMIGEIITNIGLLLATYYFDELSLIGTALIEALPPAFTGSYIIIFMGMYSFITDRTTTENRTFRMGIVTIFVNLGTPAGTALSGILLRTIGYYGMFSLLLVLHCLSFIYGVLKLEDVISVANTDDRCLSSSLKKNGEITSKLKVILGLVINTIKVAFRRREGSGRTKIFIILVLYILMVGPLYGDSQVAYLYAIRKFNLTEVEFSFYGTLNIILGLAGIIFCVTVLSKIVKVDDSVLGGIAGVSRIASCLILAFATTRQWYFSAPVFNIFSHVGLTAIRSIASKSVPAEEIAKLSSLIGVTEAIAPSIYLPTSSYIYVSTLQTFPGAFYLFDATLTLIAIVLFISIYLLHSEARSPRHEKKQNQEEISRANSIHVSRF